MDAEEQQEVLSEDTEPMAMSLLAFLTKTLVPKDEPVEIKKTVQGSSLRLSVLVPSSELGKVIGRGGRIANSIRALVRVAGAREGYETSVEFSDRQR